MKHFTTKLILFNIFIFVIYLNADAQHLTSSYKPTSGVNIQADPKDSPHGIGANDVLVYGIIKGSIKVSKYTNLQGKTPQQLKAHLQNNLQARAYELYDTSLVNPQIVDSTLVTITEAHTATDYVYNYSITNIPANRVVYIYISPMILRNSPVVKLIFGAEWLNMLAILTSEDTLFEGYHIISALK